VKVQIVSRWESSRVLYECDVPDEIDSGLHMRHALEQATASGANLSGAYLTVANLTGANLSRANLSGANLSGSKWRIDITINRAPLQLSGLYWMVYILDHHMQIGCELHTLAEWDAFDDARIVGMDGRNALRFWRAHKVALLALAASDGRGMEAAKEVA